MERDNAIIKEDDGDARSSRLESLESGVLNNNVIQFKSIDSPKSIMDAYLSYTLETESPAIYHRWSCITSISALLGRSLYIKFGHSNIFPNLYTMLLGNAGSRKSSAIKMIQGLMQQAGYDSFAAEKTRVEKFLLDLEGLEVEEEEEAVGGRARKIVKYDDITAKNLWGDDNYQFSAPREVFIVADEFNDFAGTGNVDFYTTLGYFWDWNNPTSPYRFRLKNSKSVSIFQPTITILSGNTPENFNRAFPPETTGVGFQSRLILIHGKRREKRIAFPPTPPIEESEKMIGFFKRIYNRSQSGEMTIDAEATQLLTVIYEEWNGLADLRFASYTQRRFTQLLKLCIIVSVSMWREEIDLETVLYANTILTAAENVMPSALGEFGKARNSDVTHKIMNMLKDTRKPVAFKELWNVVRNDLDKPAALQDMMQGLVHAERVQYANGAGWLPKILPKEDPEYVDWSYLSEEERSGSG